MSEVKVNKISPRSGTAITLGDSGDTFTIPSGATLAIAGSVTGFTSTGIDDNATSVAMTIDSSENIGIGTSSPSARVNILESTVGTDPTADSSNFIKLTNNDTGTTNEVFGIGFSSLSGSTDYLGAFVQALGNYSLNFNHSLIFGTRGTSGDAAERMRITSSGDVGINTSNPEDKFEVRTATRGIKIKSTGSSGYTQGGMLIESHESNNGPENRGQGVYLFNHGNDRNWYMGTLYQGSGKFGICTLSDTSQQASTASINNAKLVINTSGSVGIGTQSPQQQVDISSASPRIRFSDTSVTNLRHVIGSEANDLEIRCDDGNVQASSHIGFKIDGNEKVRITDAGNVGIGTSSPSDILHIVSTDATTVLQRTTDVGNNSTLSASEFKNSDSTV